MDWFSWYIHNTRIALDSFLFYKGLFGAVDSMYDSIFRK